MPTPPHLRVDRQILAIGQRTGGFANRLGQRHEIVNAPGRRVELTIVPDQFPATRRGEPTGVLLTQII